MNFFWKRSQFIHVLLSGMIVSVLGAVSATAAGITISSVSVSAAPGSSSDSFDVDLTNLGPSAVTIGGFSFGLSIANTDISFTDITSATGAPYIFSGNSLFGPDLSGPNSGQTISASDVVLVPSTGTTINSGETLGIGHVFFNVSAGAAPGVFAVTLASFPGSSLSDALGNNVNIDTLSPGQITITGAPEPSYFAPLLLLSAAVFLNRFRVRKPGTK